MAQLNLISSLQSDVRSYNKYIACFITLSQQAVHSYAVQIKTYGFEIKMHGGGLKQGIVFITFHLFWIILGLYRLMLWIDKENMEHGQSSYSSSLDFLDTSQIFLLTIHFSWPVSLVFVLNQPITAFYLDLRMRGF